MGVIVEVGIRVCVAVGFGINVAVDVAVGVGAISLGALQDAKNKITSRSNFLDFIYFFCSPT